MLTDEVYACHFCGRPGREYFTIEPDESWDKPTLYMVALNINTIPMCERHGELFTRLQNMYPYMEK